MNKRYYIIIAAAAILMASCGKQVEQSESTTDSMEDTSTTVETKAGNTKYKPAFEGQTRVAGVKTTIEYEVAMLDSTLTRPWGIAALPDGKFIITEKGGTMRIASATGSVGSPIRGIPKVNSERQG